MNIILQGYPQRMRLQWQPKNLPFFASNIHMYFIDKARDENTFLATYGGQKPFHPPHQTSYILVYNMIYLIWIIFISAELTIEIWECSIRQSNHSLMCIVQCAMCIVHIGTGKYLNISNTGCPTKHDGWWLWMFSSIYCIRY